MINWHMENMDFQEKKIQTAMYGGRHHVTMLPGAGIGPELMIHVTDLFR